MKCPICEQINWLDLDYLREEPLGFSVCKDCGFQGYINQKPEEKILDFYRYEYRRHPNGDNILTCNRKVGYIDHFLGQNSPLRQKKNLKVLDIGCAQGYFLHYAKSLSHRVFGTELTRSYQHFCQNQGLAVSDDINLKEAPYDFIMLFHTFEHMQEPDKKLAFYKSLLSEDGYMMIGLPIWHDVCFDWGYRAIVDFETLFHKNHINVFTYKSLTNLIHKIGFDIVKQDNRYYGHFILLKKGEVKTIATQDYQAIADSTKKQKIAISYSKAKEFKKSLETFQRYPDSYIGLAFYSNKKEFEKCIGILEEAKILMPHILELHIHCAHVYWQWKKYDKAIENIQYALQFRGNDEGCWELYGRILLEIGELEKAIAAFDRVSKMNPTRWAAMQDLLGHIYSKDWKEYRKRKAEPIPLFKEPQQEKDIKQMPVETTQDMKMARIANA